MYNNGTAVHIKLPLPKVKHNLLGTYLYVTLWGRHFPKHSTLTFFKGINNSSVVNRHRFDANPDPDLTFHFDANPDPLSD
jgi:hypothetical protein